MKKILIGLLLLTSMSAFASIDFNESTNGDLNEKEIKTVKSIITGLADAQYDGYKSSVEVNYSCSETPMVKVFCSVSLESEGGIIGAAVVKVDRVTERTTILDHVID